MKKKLFALMCMILLLAVAFAACSKMPSQNLSGDGTTPLLPEYDYSGGNSYTKIDENDFVAVTDENNKAFISLSVNTASYVDIKSQLLNRQTVSKDAVKIEEMVNYFKYDYALPQSDKPLSFSGAIFDTPWNNETQLLTVGLRAEDIKERGDTNYNIVLLVDVSGSMYGEDRLGLVIESFCLLADQFDENDVLSIVTYASSTNVVLDGVSGARKSEIKSTLKGLTAGGSTAGGSAINLAYQTAFKHKTDDNLSCIVLATDGDFNVGASSPDALKTLISENSRKGVTLSAIGVGFGNMRSDMLETIADAGDGRHGYINNLTEANKFLVEEIGGIINIVARDAKAQIEFNPDRIAKYRLIGYENRQLTIDEWQDEEKQAGAIGSGLQATAVFEVVLKEDTEDGTEENYATVSLKYKTPKTGESREDSFNLTAAHLVLIDVDARDDSDLQDSDPTLIKNEDRIFIAAIVEFGLILRNSKYKGAASYQKIYNRLVGLNCIEDDNYKKEFLDLIRFMV